ASLRRHVLRLLAGFFAATAASIVVLAYRRELTGFINTMRANVGYPNRALLIFGGRPNFYGHLRLAGRILLGDRPRAAFFLLVLLALGVLLIVALRRRSGQHDTSERADPRS